MNHPTLPLTRSGRLFAPTRLICAREFRGLTQKKLAEAVGLTSMAISGYESGNWQPAPDVTKELAAALGFPVLWFFRDEMFLVSDQALSYRGFARMTSSVRGRSRQTWNIGADLRNALSDAFDLPPVDLPDLSDETPEEAAHALRKMWGLGNDPVPNLVHLLESKGVAVFWSDVDSRSVDAYCNWHDDWPLVVLKSLESAGERGRFNAAHELGHLVLHRELDVAQKVNDDVDGRPGPDELILPRQEMEKEAHRFAAAFLLPEIAWIEEAPHSTNLDAYLRIKEYWGISVQAMLRRSYSLDLITERQYESAMTQVSVRHWRMDEPEPVSVEQSLLHQRLFEMMAEDGQSSGDFANQLGLNPDDLEVLMPVASQYRNTRHHHSRRATLTFPGKN